MRSTWRRFTRIDGRLLINHVCRVKTALAPRKKYTSSSGIRAKKVKQAVLEELDRKTLVSPGSPNNFESTPSTPRGQFLERFELF